MEYPRYSLSVQTAPAAAILTTALAKEWLRIDHSSEDTLVDTLVSAVRNDIENYCETTLITTVYDLKLDYWPGCRVIYLPRGPVQSVTSITYLDSSGASQTWASSNYVTDLGHASPRIGLADGVSYPTIDNRIAAITVRYTAGYGDAASDIPDALLAAARLMIADYYENRQLQQTANLIYNKTVDRLLQQYKTRNVLLGGH